MIKEAMQVASVFERDPAELGRFFEESGQTYADVLVFYNYLVYELDLVDQKFQEQEYTKQVQTTFSIVPKQIETVISKQLVNELLEMDTDSDISDSSEVLDILKEVGVTGYKFQLKYLITVFENLLQAPIWEFEHLGEEYES